MGRCFLCRPPTDLADEQIATHMLVEHEIDIEALAEKWPDGEFVVRDESLSPEDFAD